MFLYFEMNFILIKIMFLVVLFLNNTSIMQAHFAHSRLSQGVVRASREDNFNSRGSIILL
jgi:hypothetical protein